MITREKCEEAYEIVSKVVAKYRTYRKSNI